MADPTAMENRPMDRAGLLAERIKHLARLLSSKVEDDHEAEAVCFVILESAQELERIVDAEALK